MKLTYIQPADVLMDDGSVLIPAGRLMVVHAVPAESCVEAFGEPVLNDEGDITGYRYTAEQYRDFVIARLRADLGGEVEITIMPDDWQPPADRTFRNAWEVNGRTRACEVNMTKAREVWKDKLREMRKPKLDALDVEYQRADEKGDTAAKAEIAAKKQALRDVTADPAIASATTPDELKAAVPDVLK